MTYRPRNTHKDENHHIIDEFMATFCGGFESHVDGRVTAYTANFRGRLFTAYDMANVGGLMPDWLVECYDTCRVMWIEIKAERAFYKNDDRELKKGELKPGEKWLMEHSHNWRILVTEDDVQALFEEMIR